MENYGISRGKYLPVLVENTRMRLYFG